MKPIPIVAALLLSAIALQPLVVIAQAQKRADPFADLNAIIAKQQAQINAINAKITGIAPTPIPTPAPAPTSDVLTQFMDQLEAIKLEVINGVVADLAAADGDAATLTNPSDPTSFRDPIAHACYPAATKFLQSFPAAQPLQGAPYDLAQLFQRRRDFIAQVKAGLPPYLVVGCSGLLGDEVKTFITIMGMVGVKIGLAGATALLPALAPITLPALTVVP